MLGTPSGVFFWNKRMNKIQTLVGKKLQMDQTFVDSTRVPVTMLEVGPCVVTQIKNNQKDGYWAVQLGFGNRKTEKLTKPMQGHLKGVSKDKKAPRFLFEVRLDIEPEVKVGDVITLSDIFKKGDIIAVTGISKGKGFAGGMKRWGFAGGPRTHGQSDRPRSPGSIGQGTTPGRVHKGKKMAGRMGNERVTIKNLQVVDINTENNSLAVSGPVPGTRGSIIFIKKLSSGKLSELTSEAPEVVEQKEVKEEGSNE